MTPRFFVDQPLATGADLTLPPGPARHVQVLRLQPGSSASLFNGDGGDFAATVTYVGRHEVTVRVGAYNPVARELARSITLAVGMPTNERMDALIEKTTELGMSRFVPLMCKHSVLRLHGERAEKRLAHWRGVAVAACEQSGRARLPTIEPVTDCATWLQALPTCDAGVRWILSMTGAPARLQLAVDDQQQPHPVTLLSGPEGGLSAAEDTLAKEHGFTEVSLGPRVLRADTAPLAALAYLSSLLDVQSVGESLTNTR